MNIKELLEPDTATHQRWLQELDLLADGLRELRDADVVVLWRPFHEMNGGWFWWGAQDPDAFIQVWRQMFDYFTKTKQLNNLLWAYSPNQGTKTAAYYAGDRYVDLVGLDAYTDFVDPEHIQGATEVTQLPKPFGFTEYGPHGPQNPPGDYDYMKFLAGVRNHFPRTAFFQAWSSRWGLGQPEHQATSRRPLADQPRGSSARIRCETVKPEPESLPPSPPTERACTLLSDILARFL